MDPIDTGNYPQIFLTRQIFKADKELMQALGIERFLLTVFQLDVDIGFTGWSTSTSWYKM